MKVILLLNIGTSNIVIGQRCYRILYITGCVQGIPHSEIRRIFRLKSRNYYIAILSFVYCIFLIFKIQHILLEWCIIVNRSTYQLNRLWALLVYCKRRNNT